MINFPNAKINLGLPVLHKLTDGFHDLASVFYPIHLHDALEFVESDQFHFSCTGISVLGNLQDNLVIKAYQLLKKDFPQIPNLSIHLHKAIPSGAGLGGGSADASFMLMMLNKKYQLEINHKQMLIYAAQLGSDCPFFIINTPCLAGGRGEILTPISLYLNDYYMLIVKPNIPISTPWAFKQIQPKDQRIDLSTIINQPIENWKEVLKNDFEAPIISHYPELGLVKEKMYHLGATYASMSGSGSAFFGLFQNEPVIEYQFPYQEVFLLKPSTNRSDENLV